MFCSLLQSGQLQHVSQPYAAPPRISNRPSGPLDTADFLDTAMLASPVPGACHGGGDLGGGKTVRDFSDREAQLSSNHSLDRYPERIQIDLRHGSMAADVKMFDGSFPRLDQLVQCGFGVHRCGAVNNQLLAVGVVLPGKYPRLVDQTHGRAGGRQTQPVTPIEISFRK